MSKNKIKIPKFLIVEAARKLNNLVYGNTGCFLFLTYPDEEILLPTPEASGCDCYRYNVINLYRMYNDYGHFFLWCAMQQLQLPDVTKIVDVSLRENAAKLAIDQPRVMKHYEFIVGIARHVIAHGIFQRRKDMSNYSDPKITALEEIFIDVLSGKRWPEDQSDWNTINEWLVREADHVYDWLWLWAKVWGDCPVGVELVRDRFYYGRWGYSANKVICRSADKTEAVIPKMYNGKMVSIYEEKDDPTSFAKVFTLQFVSDASDYLSAAASDCKSDYEEDRGPWKSDRPKVNIICLYKNINYSGIENVRRKMYGDYKKGALCPDGYKLYLEGLTGEMIKLPKINSKPRPKSRFNRDKLS